MRAPVGSRRAIWSCVTFLMGSGHFFVVERGGEITRIFFMPTSKPVVMLVHTGHMIGNSSVHTILLSRLGGSKAWRWWRISRLEGWVEFLCCRIASPLSPLGSTMS